MNEDNTVRLVIGSAGGTKITTGVAQGIIHNIFLNKDIKTTVDHPRIHHNVCCSWIKIAINYDFLTVIFINTFFSFGQWQYKENAVSTLELSNI